MFISDMPRLTRTQKWIVGFIVVLAVVNTAYRLVYATGVQKTAALFVGLPALLAISLATLPRRRSATGALLKWSTLVLMIAAVVTPEGLLCLLFALPLVALIAIIVGGAIDFGRWLGQRERTGLMVVSLPLLLFSLEGVVGSPFNGHDAVTRSITVEATPAEVEAALASEPSFESDVPIFLSLGFNRPVSATGHGIDPGDERVITFNGGSHDDHPLRVIGLTGERSVEHMSDMHMTVAESSPGKVVFEVEHDMTMLARWADLDRSVVTWRQLADGRTKVTWRLEYERLLYPTAYFGPLQRFGMGEAAGYLLEAVIADPLAT